MTYSSIFVANFTGGDVVVIV